MMLQENDNSNNNTRELLFLNSFILCRDRVYAVCHNGNELISSQPCLRTSTSEEGGGTA